MLDSGLRRNDSIGAERVAMNLWSYILKRVLLMIPTLLGVIAITFAVIQFVPGGPVEQALIELKKGQVGAGESSGGGRSEYRGRQGIDPERVEEIKALYGFDKPPLERFWQMLKGFAKFDLGQSFYHHQDVWQLVKSKLPVSISIGLWTFFLTYLISVPLGIAKAVREGSRFDHVTSMVVLRSVTRYQASCWALHCWCCLPARVLCSGSRCVA